MNMTKDKTVALNFIKAISSIIIAYLYHYKNNFCDLIGNPFPLENFRGGGKLVFE